jgi:hypothetical protein
MYGIFVEIWFQRYLKYRLFVNEGNKTYVAVCQFMQTLYHVNISVCHESSFGEITAREPDDQVSSKRWSRTLRSLAMFRLVGGSPSSARDKAVSTWSWVRIFLSTVVSENGKPLTLSFHQASPKRWDKSTALQWQNTVWTTEDSGFDSRQE